MLLTVAYSEGNLHRKGSGYNYLIAQKQIPRKQLPKVPAVSQVALIKSLQKIAEL